MKRCLKQVVKASIVKEGITVVVAYNDITNEDVSQCPRMGMPSGEGYEYCRHLCKQQGHAEIQALNRARYLDIDVRGCTLILEGHSYVCEECQKQLIKEGITEWVLTSETS